MVWQAAQAVGEVASATFSKELHEIFTSISDEIIGKISCKVSFLWRMSPEMTDFHFIPSSADDGTLRGFPFWEVFRHAEAR